MHLMGCVDATNNIADSRPTEAMDGNMAMSYKLMGPRALVDREIGPVDPHDHPRGVNGPIFTRALCAG